MSLRKRIPVNLSTASSYFLYASLMIFAVLCIVGMAAVILTAYFGVPIGDDYLAIKTYSDRHTWLSEAWYSLTHTGRYLQSIASSVAYGSMRSHIAVILPLVILTWLYMLIFASGRLISTRTEVKLTTTQNHFLSSAILVIFVTAGQVVEKSGVWLMYQSFYFSSAIVTYTVALLLYGTLFYLYARYHLVVEKYKKTSLILFIVFTFALGLFNETLPATLFGLSIFVVFCSLMYKRRAGLIKSIRKYSLALAGSSIIALVAMYLSPSSSARRETTGAMQETDLLLPIFNKTLNTITQFFFQPADLLLMAVFAVLIFSFILSRARKNRSAYLKLVILGGFVTFASVMALIAATTLLILGYGISTPIYPRTLLLVQILYVVGTMTLFIGLVGYILKSVPARFANYSVFAVSLIAILSTLLVSTSFVERFANDISGVAEYNAIWNRQDDLLREEAANDQDETVYLDDSGAGIGDGFSIECNSPFSKNTIWLNDGIEAYYGIDEICSKSDL